MQIIFFPVFTQNVIWQQKLRKIRIHIVEEQGMQYFYHFLCINIIKELSWKKHILNNFQSKIELYDVSYPMFAQ